LEHGTRWVWLVQKQPVSDALEVGAFVTPFYSLPRLTRIDALVEEHLVSNKRAIKNGIPELTWDTLHAVQLLRRQMDQDGLEQLERVKRLLAHLLAVRSFGIGSSPSAIISRLEERIYAEARMR
jgi:hypothetical protein